LSKVLGTYFFHLVPIAQINVLKLSFAINYSSLIYVLFTMIQLRK